MFVLRSCTLLSGFYILSALLPAVFLLIYIYRHDTVEKEPPALLGSLLLLGVLSALCASVLERLAQRLLLLAVEPGSPLFTILTAFFAVAAVEEGTKYFFLKRRTWWDPNFNYRFDGIVYAVFLSLGFAGYENIQYILRYGLSVALPRALLAVPGHLAFAVFMGLFYSRAKLASLRGDSLEELMNLFLACASAILLHGFYDACAMVGTTPSTILFGVFVLGMYLAVYRIVRRESRQDAPL